MLSKENKGFFVPKNFIAFDLHERVTFNQLTEKKLIREKRLVNGNRF